MNNQRLTYEDIQQVTAQFFLDQILESSDLFGRFKRRKEAIERLKQYRLRPLDEVFK